MKIYDIDAFEKLKIRAVDVKRMPSVIEYKYHPKTDSQLINLIDKRIQDEGPDCDLNDIDVSAIGDMHCLFGGTDFCGDISLWDVSNVKNMQDMFFDCNNFNCDISKWNVWRCEIFISMFQGCTNFNQNLNSWKPINAKSTYGMFKYCTDFNQPLNNWGKYLDKNEDYSQMFYKCSSFDQDLSSWNTLGKYNEDMFYMCPIKQQNKPYNIYG